MTELLLIFSYLTVIAVANAKQYRKMLFLNIISCWLCGLYLYLNMAYVGASVSTIAGVASLIQLCLPVREAKRNAPVRNGVAIGFATLAASILYSKPSDLLPCIAFTLHRFSEAQENPHLIRLGLIVGGCLWAAYAAHNGLYLFVAIESITIAFVIYATYVKKIKTEQPAYAVTE
jgi:hypothetical protein